MPQPETNKPKECHVNQTWQPDYSTGITEAFYRTAWKNGCCKFCCKLATFYTRLNGAPSIIEIPCDCDESFKAKEAFIRERTRRVDEAQAPVYDPNKFIEPEEKIF